MKILSAAYANAERTAVVGITENYGIVSVCLYPQKENIVGGQQAFAEFLAADGIVQPFQPQVPDPIALAESHITKFFTSGQLQKIMLWVIQKQPNLPEKLAATYVWEETISSQALTGVTDFAEAPFTFLEVAREVLPQ
ncbi:MAG: hypothetical protein WC069_06425 [Candidatus Shapirobacteria bacterium]|nr:hypothetical protein [Terrimicrobiaceae bacterium]